MDSTARPLPGGKLYLLCFDESDISLRALQFAVSLCTSADVIEIFQVFEKQESKDDDRPTLMIALREILETGLGDKKPHAFRSDVAFGDVKHSIIEKIQISKPTAVIVGSRNHGTIEDLVLGSVSNYVVHHSSVPVILVKHQHSE